MPTNNDVIPGLTRNARAGPVYDGDAVYVVPCLHRIASCRPASGMTMLSLAIIDSAPAAGALLSASTGKHAVVTFGDEM